jgi:uncharacterized membrane protein YhaH (DUF805 family)
MAFAVAARRGRRGILSTMENRETTRRPLSMAELSTVALGSGPDHMPFAALYLRARGRVSRRTFWLHGVLALLVIGVLANAVMDIAGVTTDNTDRLINLLLVWPLLAISAKRAHDFNWSGWWVLLHFVPVIGSLAMILILGSVPGTPGPNRFGPDPFAGPAEPALNNAH